MSNRSTTMSIELDIAFDEDQLADALVRLTNDYESLTYRIVALEGPAGGWPSVRFVGEAADVTAFLLEYCAGDAQLAYETLMA